MTMIFQNLKIKTCPESSSISEVIEIMSGLENEYLKGLVGIVSRGGKLVGCFADGDIRRIISKKTNLNSKINSVMVKNPISILDTKLHNDSAWKEIDLIEENLKRRVKAIFVVNKHNKVLDVVVRNFYQNHISAFKGIDSCIMGLGFVGLTVACHIAASGSRVIGYDNNSEIIMDLQKCITKFEEPGLKDALKSSVKKNLLEFNSKLPESLVYMIAVGTPVSLNGSPDLSHVKGCLDEIAKVLPSGGLIIIRSTVPLGSSREVFVPYLEKKTGMRCGQDWHLSFAPERTLEGSALHELRNLPQIISGYSEVCMMKAVNYFSSFCKNVVAVESLESAELAKLACNTYRDLKFSFANEISNICESYNINSRKLISKINFDYERAGIPLPSPGVGGYCLTKDPILYTHPSKSPNYPIELGKISRKINNYATLAPLRAFENFCSRFNLEMKKLNVLLIGIAFKGHPETNDMRFSTSLDFFHEIHNSVSKIYGYDNCIDQKELCHLGFHDGFKINKIKEYDISGIFYLNNHAKNQNINLVSWLEIKKPKFIFDGWGCREDLESYHDKYFSYLTLGKVDPINL